MSKEKEVQLSLLIRKALYIAIEKPPCILLPPIVQQELKTILKQNTTISRICGAIKSSSIESYINQEGTVLREACDRRRNEDPSRHVVYENFIEAWIVCSTKRAHIRKTGGKVTYALNVFMLEELLKKSLETKGLLKIDPAAPMPEMSAPQNDHREAPPSMASAPATTAPPQEQKEAALDIVSISGGIISFRDYAHYIAEHIREGKQQLLARLKDAVEAGEKRIKEILESDGEAIIKALHPSSTEPTKNPYSVKELAGRMSGDITLTRVNSLSYQYIKILTEGKKYSTPLTPSEHHLLQYISCISQSVDKYNQIDPISFEKSLTENFFTQALRTCIEPSISKDVSFSKE